MPHRSVLACLMVSLMGASTTLSWPIAGKAQSYPLISHPLISKSVRLRPQPTFFQTSSRANVPLVFNRGPTQSVDGGGTRDIIIQRQGGYCGPGGGQPTVLVPSQGLSWTTNPSVDLWVSLPVDLANQGSQQFQLQVFPPAGSPVLTQTIAARSYAEGLLKITIPPQAFRLGTGRSAEYRWQLTYTCPGNPLAAPIRLSGSIGIQPQAIAKTLSYRDRLRFYGERSHWFDLLNALITPPPGSQKITKPELKALLELDSVQLGDFYPELEALIFADQTTANSLSRQLESLTNSSRVQENLSALPSTPALNQAAQNYANLMAKNNCPLIHDCGGIGLSDRLKNQGIPTTFRAENLVRVPKDLPNPGQTAFDTLQQSWPHRRNSHIPEWRNTGVGVAETPTDYYFVQIFNQPAGLPSFESQHDVILPTNSPTPRLDFEQALLQRSAAEGISLIEGKGLRNFAQFLGTSSIKRSNSPSPQAISSSLAQATRETQKKIGIVYVIATEETLLLYLVVPQANGQPHLIQKTVPVSRLKVLGTAQQFRKRVVNPTHETDFLPYATQLHHWMIDPLQSSLDELGLETLLFTLDDGLRSIPMAALHNGKNFLIERYSMALLPSFGLTESGPFEAERQNILAMGIAQSHGGLSALPAVKTEIDEIAKLFPQSQVQVTLNEQTTVEKLASLSQAQKYGIIHLATHAQFRPQKAGESFLQFWNRRLSLQGLGALGRRLQWDAAPSVELLVMSACTTAMGDRTAELGFAGSAVLAGVKSTVASLWNVKDVSSTAFMIDFYRNLPQSPTKTEAFRQTQMAMIRGQLRIQNGMIVFPNQSTVMLPGSMFRSVSLPLSHPYYWAGQTVIGNWN